jgi:hypothetical protein
VEEAMTLRKRNQAVAPPVDQAGRNTEAGEVGRRIEEGLALPRGNPLTAGRIGQAVERDIVRVPVSGNPRQVVAPHHPASERVQAQPVLDPSPLVLAREQTAIVRSSEQ